MYYFEVMELIFSLYVISSCSDPDWDGTVTEPTDVRLLFRLDFEKCYTYINLYWFTVNQLFERSRVQ